MPFFKIILYISEYISNFINEELMRLLYIFLLKIFNDFINMRKNDAIILQSY